MSKITYTTTGPLFDGHARQTMGEVVEDFERDFADEVMSAIKARLGQVLQHPTGRYQARISTTRMGGGVAVWDNRAVYGSWLEGVSRRNRASRFKGYKTFRMVTQKMDAKAAEAAQAALQARLSEMT